MHFVNCMRIRQNRCSLCSHNVFFFSFFYCFIAFIVFSFVFYCSFMESRKKYKILRISSTHFGFVIFVYNVTKNL